MIYLFQLQGFYAFVEFSSIDSALEVLHYSFPIYLNGKVLKIRQREYKPRVPKKQLLNKDNEELEELDEEKVMKCVYI